MRVEKENYFLEISNAELKDEAEYTCDTGEVKTTAKLNVKGKIQAKSPLLLAGSKKHKHTQTL